MAALSCVLLMKVVVRSEPFTWTTDAGMKLLPLRINVNPPLLATTVSGERLVKVGSGLRTSKLRDHTPPPGGGFATDTERNAAEAVSLAGMAAVSCVLLTKVVVRLEPFTWTTDAGMKLLPLRVMVTEPLPAMTVSGERLVRVGSGLRTSKLRDHTPPPGVGFTTETERNAADATSTPRIAAVSCVLLTKVVARLEPFTWTTDAGTKLLPVRVIVNPPLPAITVSGERLVSFGAGFGPGLLTASVRGVDVPPPGVGFITETERVLTVAMSLAGMVALS